ncbi:hypothetical protein [Nocardia sp. NPDC050175]|uniref:hypothetical protein n=1 Tax=Nocardia sp. NPDC050175 TaxID=3364317 RepID=UPI0037A82A25
MTYLVVDQRIRDVRRWVRAYAAGSEHRRATGPEVVLLLADSMSVRMFDRASIAAQLGATAAA